MPEVDPVILQLKVENGKYIAALNSAADKFDSSVKRMENKAVAAERVTSNAFGKIGAALRGVAAITGISAAAIAGAVGTAVVATVRYAGAIKEMSEKLGVSTKALQEYRYAAGAVRVADEELEKGLGSLNKLLQEASLSAEKPVKIFDTLGIKIRDSVGQVRNAADVLPQLADRLKAIKDPTERAAVATQIFGENAAALRPLLDQGSAGIDNLRDAAQRLGVVLSDKQIQEADVIARKLNDLKTVLSANIAAAVINNADAILTLAGAFVTLTDNILGTIQAFSNWRALGAYNSATATPAQKQQAVRTLAQTHSGRVALINSIGAQQDENIQERATGRLSRDAMGAPTLFSRKMTSKEVAQNDALFKANNRLQNALLALDKKGGADVPALLGPSPMVGNLLAPRGSGGRTAKPKEDRTDEYEARFQNSLSRLQDEYLEAFAATTRTVQDKLAAEQSRIETDRIAYQRSVEVDDKLNEAQKAALVAANDKVAAQQQLALLADEERRLAQEHFDSMAEGIRTSEDWIRANAELLSSRQDQLAAQLTLLDLQRQQEDATLDLVLATEAAGSAAWKDAEARKAILEDLYKLRGRSIGRQFESPLARLRRETADTAANMNDHIEDIEVDAINRLSDGLTDAATKYIKLGGIAGDVINGIIRDLIRLAIQQQVVGAITGGGGSIFSAIGSFFGLGGAITGGGGPTTQGFTGPAMASGGSMVIGGRGGVDQNLLSINGRPVARVSQGETLNVVPADARAGGGRTTIVNQSFHLDARGSVGIDELVAYVNNTARQAAMEGAQGGHALARRDMASLTRRGL